MIHSQSDCYEVTKIRFNCTALGMLLIAFMLLLSPAAFSQTSDSTQTTASTTTTQQNDTAVNKTMKSVFGELKKITRQGNATLNSILMILGVVSVVAIAMWLSFRSNPEEEGA